jgi:hypothetical protein
LRCAVCLVVVRAVAVVREQPDQARLAAQDLGDGAVDGLAQVGVGQRRPFGLRAVSRPARAARTWSAVPAPTVSDSRPRGDGAPGSDWLKAASTSASPGRATLPASRHQRLERRLRIAVEGFHPARVLHQHHVRDGLCRRRAEQRGGQHGQ